MPQNRTFHVGTHGDAFNFESVTVGSTSVGLTQTAFNPPYLPKAQYALITVETDQIRWRYNGGAATSTSHLANVGDVIELEGINNIQNFRAIRVTADAAIRVTYER